MLIIGLGHKKRVGKDTFADIIHSDLLALGYKVQRLSFATAFKDIAHSLFDISDLDKTDVTPYGMTVRDIYLHIGLSMRQLDPNVWVRNCFKKIKAETQVVIITDVRFPNEIEYIKKCRHVLVKVERPCVINMPDGADDALNGIHCWDYTVVNDRDLIHLARQADAFMLFVKEYI